MTGLGLRVKLKAEEPGFREVKVSTTKDTDNSQTKVASSSPGGMELKDSDSLLKHLLDGV